MFRLIVFLVSHGLAMTAGFALGVYLLPIITAPEAPSATAVASVAEQAMFSTRFLRDLPGRASLRLQVKRRRPGSGSGLLS